MDDPATAYAAQFIGQTNLLRAEVRDGIATRRRDRVAHVGSDLGHRHVLAAAGMHTPGSDASGANRRADVTVARFRGRMRNQTFGGAMDLLEIDCGDSARDPRAHRQSRERQAESGI